MPPVPAEIAAGICAVMAGVKKLEKDETNPFAKYKYAGIEGFLEMTRPLCAEAGLVILQEEAGYTFKRGAEKIDPKTGEDKTRSWLVMDFTFLFCDAESGATWGPLHRTSMVEASMGSQAFGAAQSYALKQLMRSVFQIATGDSEDVDKLAKEDLPAGAQVHRGKATRGTRTRRSTRELEQRAAEEPPAQTESRPSSDTLEGEAPAADPAESPPVDPDNEPMNIWFDETMEQLKAAGTMAELGRIWEDPVTQANLKTVSAVLVKTATATKDAAKERIAKSKAPGVEIPA